MKANEKQLDFSELRKGMRVVDSDGDVGYIRDCDDIHNVFVVYDLGGSGLYCFDKDCEEYYPNLYDFN